MEKIIKKYYLEPGSKLVSQQIGTNGVDCWFDTDSVRQHRCIDFVDYIRTFTTLKTPEVTNINPKMLLSKEELNIT